MLSKNPEERPSVREVLNTKIIQVAYTENGIPVFKDF
jgi:calcium/calmodulin-dependent protein kinase I